VIEAPSAAFQPFGNRSSLSYHQLSSFLSTADDTRTPLLYFKQASRKDTFYLRDGKLRVKDAHPMAIFGMRNAHSDE
jgi:hypothetical protein